MRSSSPNRAALAALLGSLILSAPALAQSVANPNDQPTAGTLPSGTDTVRGNERDQNRTSERSTGEVSPPSAIRSSTAVMPEGRSSGKTVRTNPTDHLSKPFRTSYEN